MSKWLISAGCVGLVVLLAQDATIVDAQGPIREGARRTGRAVAEGTEAAVEGTRRVIRGAGEVAAGTARGTAEAARRLTGRETRYDAQGRPYYVDAEGQYQYAEAEGQAQLPREQYQSGYRGVQGQPMRGDAGQGYTVFTDRCGRQFICVNGRRSYIDQQQQQAPELAEQQDYEGSYEARRPSLDDEQAPMSEESSRAVDESQEFAAPPAPPEGAESTAPASQPSIDTQDQSNTNQSSNLNADSSTDSSDGSSPTDSSANENPPSENEAP